MTAYRPEIDGLRAVAVLVVILFHAGFPGFAGGFVGVDVFFVISGYLITRIIAHELSGGRFSFLRFYERRARRILPALFLVVLVCVPFAWALLLPDDLVDFSQSAIAVVLYVSNILFWLEDDYFSTASELKPLIHTWSLGVEEQFYFVFPALLLVAWKLPRSRVPLVLVALALASFLLSVWWTDRHPSANFFLAPTRFWEFLLGSLIALRPGKDPGTQAGNGLSLLGLALVLVAVVAFDPRTPFPGVTALVPVVGTVLLIRFATPETLVGRLLSTRPFVLLGLISYSAYLWHQPIFAFYRHWSIEEPRLSTFIPLTLLSLGLAYLSWRVVEQPFRRRDRVSGRAILASTATASAAVIAIGLAGMVGNGFPDRLGPELAEEWRLKGREHPVRKLCQERLADSQELSAACPLGAAGAAPSFMLIGDSHAMALLSALDDGGRARQIGGLGFTSATCLPVIESNPKWERSREGPLCRRIRDSFFAGLATPDIPGTVVIAARWTNKIELEPFDNGEGARRDDGRPWVNRRTRELGYVDALGWDIRQSVDAVLASGRRVVLVYPVPEMGWDVRRRLIHMHWRGLPIAEDTASIAHAVFQQRNRRTYELLDSIGDDRVIRVYPEGELCNSMVAGRCIGHRNGESLYYDSNHLSAAGASMVAARILDALQDDIDDQAR